MKLEYVKKEGESLKFSSYEGLRKIILEIGNEGIVVAFRHNHVPSRLFVHFSKIKKSWHFVYDSKDYMEHEHGDFSEADMKEHSIHVFKVADYI